MTYSNARRVLLGAILTTALVLSADAPSLHAQAAASRPVVLALPDAPPEGAAALIVRDRDKDVIVLTDRTDLAGSFGAALGLLRRARADRLRPDGTEILTVTGFAPLRSERPGRRRALRAALRRLEAARATRLGDLGTGRWIRLPAAAVGG